MYTILVEIKVSLKIAFRLFLDAGQNDQLLAAMAKYEQSAKDVSQPEEYLQTRKSMAKGDIRAIVLDVLGSAYSHNCVHVECSDRGNIFTKIESLSCFAAVTLELIKTLKTENLWFFVQKREEGSENFEGVAHFM